MQGIPTFNILQNPICALPCCTRASSTRRVATAASRPDANATMRAFAARHRCTSVRHFSSIRSFSQPCGQRQALPRCVQDQEPAAARQVQATELGVRQRAAGAGSGAAPLVRRGTGGASQGVPVAAARHEGKWQEEAKADRAGWGAARATSAQAWRSTASATACVEVARRTEPDSGARPGGGAGPPVAVGCSATIGSQVRQCAVCRTYHYLCRKVVLYSALASCMPERHTPSLRLECVIDNVAARHRWYARVFWRVYVLHHLPKQALQAVAREH